MNRTFQTRLRRAEEQARHVQPAPQGHAIDPGLREIYLGLLPLAVRRCLLNAMRKVKTAHDKAGDFGYQPPSQEYVPLMPPTARTIYFDWSRRAGELTGLLKAAAYCRGLPLPAEVQQARDAWEEEARALTPAEQKVASYVGSQP